MKGISWKLVLIGPFIITLISGLIPFKSLINVYSVTFGRGFPLHYWVINYSDDVGPGIIDATNYFNTFGLVFDLIFWFVILILLKLLIFIKRKIFLLIK